MKKINLLLIKGNFVAIMTSDEEIIYKHNYSDTMLKLYRDGANVLLDMPRFINPREVSKITTPEDMSRLIFGPTFSSGRIND